jgi:hypothetical protein
MKKRTSPFQSAMIFCTVQKIEGSRFVVSLVGDTGFEPATSSTPSGCNESAKNPVFIAFHARIFCEKIF